MQKTIIVTGAGSGIGKATATAFLENGYKVGFLGRRADTLENAANGHENALILPCDVSDPNDVETAFATAMASWAGLMCYLTMPESAVRLPRLTILMLMSGYRLSLLT